MLYIDQRESEAGVSVVMVLTIFTICMHYIVSELNCFQRNMTYYMGAFVHVLIVSGAS